VGCACELDEADGGGLRRYLDAHIRPNTGRSHLSERLSDSHGPTITFNLNLFSHIKMRFYFKSEIHIKSNPLVCFGTSIKALFSSWSKSF
jgi:hypothetical protein